MGGGVGVRLEDAREDAPDGGRGFGMRTGCRGVAVTQAFARIPENLAYGAFHGVQGVGIGAYSAVERA